MMQFLSTRRKLWLSTICLLIGISNARLQAPVLDSVQCRLETGGTIDIQYSNFLESYVEVNVDHLTEILWGDDDYTNENPIMQVRVCWCSQYFDRQYEYCPEQFDSCSVESFDGPITCFQDPKGGAFVRGFWFICVFWFVALVYAFSCTEQGSSARGFVKRKFCLRCTNSATDEAFLINEIETMIEQDPDRATWLLRSAFMRERNRQRIQEARLARRRGRMREGGSTAREQTTEGTNDDTTASNSPNADNSLSAWQQTMELRVKKYEGSEAANPAEAGGEEFSLASASKRISNALNLDVVDDEDAKCAICLSTVQVGDRIGDIPCGHIYCVDCLKDWLKRKNHCPLCMRGGLATPARTSSSSGPSSASPLESVTSVVSSTQLDDPEEGVEVAARRSLGTDSLGLIVSMPDILSTSRGRREQS